LGPELKSTGSWKQAQEIRKKDIISLIAKYFFHYEQKSTNAVHLYIKKLIQNQKQTENTPIQKDKNENTTIADIFVKEAISLLTSVSDEQTLLTILKNFKYFSSTTTIFFLYLLFVGQFIEISNKLRLELQSALYALTRPGAPSYPTRNVRHEAASVLDELFPVLKISSKKLTL
jgi:hypothetical protein